MSREAERVIKRIDELSVGDLLDVFVREDGNNGVLVFTFDKKQKKEDLNLPWKYCGRAVVESFGGGGTSYGRDQGDLRDCTVQDHIRHAKIRSLGKNNEYDPKEELEELDAHRLAASNWKFEVVGKMKKQVELVDRVCTEEKITFV